MLTTAASRTSGPVRGYRDLIVWQDSMDLVLSVYCCRIAERGRNPGPDRATAGIHHRGRSEPTLGIVQRHCQDVWWIDTIPAQTASLWSRDSEDQPGLLTPDS